MSGRIPKIFEYRNRKEFHEKLVEWIGDVLYDILPEHGYEIRDEQIFTAFQIADAMCNNEVHLAEAALGTGKTFAYLLSAIPYARMTGKPVVVACASTALQEQLAGDTGDIKTLFKLLGIDVDVRMAKDPYEYVCDAKADEYIGDFGEVSDQVRDWLKTTKCGERSELPTISDREWKQISWDETMGCDVCDNRGYCKMIKAREYYKAARDLIIVDHETFFHDLWTREECKLDGKLPILPSYSAVIFDEGHKILLPAIMKAGFKIDPEEIQTIVESVEGIQGARESFFESALAMEQASNDFFEQLQESVKASTGAERLTIKRTNTLEKTAVTFAKTLDRFLLELQIEQELYTESIPDNLIKAFEGQVERASRALNLYVKKSEDEIISWVQRFDESFVVVPRNIGELLQKHLFKQEIPVIFTSATLSNEGNFDYFIRSIGLVKPTKSTIGSPFELEDKVVNYLYEYALTETFEKRIQCLDHLLRENDGRTLVLVNDMDEVKKIRETLENEEYSFHILWEDEADRGYLIREFREDERSVLVGMNFWEGIDIPGDSLTQVIIWELPFPNEDPLIEAQRKDAKKQGLNVLNEVDLPEMGLKLKQGCGRLIRTKDDHGRIVILDAVRGEIWEHTVLGSLAKETPIEDVNSISSSLC